MKIQDKKILITGVTGAVGSWIAAEALNQGGRILAVMRDKNSETARQRIRKALNIAGTTDRDDAIDIIRGDICNSLEDLAENAKIADVTMIMHCAASTEFSDHLSKQSIRTNIEGTKNVLKLASKLTVPFCYISTAYIAGRREVTAGENEIDIGQSFNNVYERTKCQAEKLVHDWSKETGLPVFVFRPSIVIGDSKKGCIARFNGIYNILRFFDTVGTIIGNEEIRVVANADTTKNLIPVDYLAKAVWHIINSGAANTYHITNPIPLTLGQLRDIYSKLFGINAKFITEDEFLNRKATRAELLYRKAIALYSPYMVSEPIFDRTNTDAVSKDTDLDVPQIDSAYCARILEYARSVQWGKSTPQENHRCNPSFALIEDYFNSFLKAKLHQRLLPDLRRLSATFRIVMKENPDKYWSLAIEQGVLTRVSGNGMICDCSFIVDRKTFCDITSSRITPQNAFFNKTVDIEGNIEIGLKLVTVLAAFFKKYPYYSQIHND